MAVDRTEASRRASEFVDRFFSDIDADITAVNVSTDPLDRLPGVPYGGLFAWHWPLYAAPEHRTVTQDVVEEQRAQSERIAAAQAPRGAEAEARFGGDTADVISQAAADHDADLIVVGANDKGFLERLMGGSVSADLARHASRPVLVVR